METPGILNQNEYVELIIQWNNNELSVRVRDQPAFIKYVDPNPHKINHVGVRTGWGSIGHWKIEGRIFTSLPVSLL